uniref:Rev n=1 Tax=Equine infectious anemia virus TaxID=11665 RepID=A0A8A3BCK6_9RETR|nr:rev [Equine infectious anemia virus]
MAEGRKEDRKLKEEREEQEDGKRNDWWKIVPQGPLDNDGWCRVLRQSLPEEEIPSQTCIARRQLGPGPVQHTPSRRDRWLRGQLILAEGLQEQLAWRIRGVQQKAKELDEVNKGIWRELHYTERQHGKFSSWDGYRRQEQRHWGEEAEPRCLKPRNPKRGRKHL